MKVILLLFLAVTMFAGGCAHKAKVHTAPDAAPVTTRQAQVKAQFAAAKMSHRKAAEANTKAQTSHTAETEQITVIWDKLDAPVFQNAPVEFREALSSVRGEVDTLNGLHDMTAAALDETRAAQGELGKVLERGNAVANELSDKYGPEYVALVEAQTAAFNAVEVKWAKDSKALLWYRTHWWGAWIVAGLGVLACGFVAFLKVSGGLVRTIR